MGVVYKAYDTVLRKFVALKTIRGAVDPDALAMFERECTVLARLSHPNIVDILDTGEILEDNQQKPYFVMPFLPGATLDKLIKTAAHRLTPDRVVDIMCQACKGLQAAHDQGLVHRDLKPSNLFVLEDDSVTIIDFGVVHLAGSESRTGIKGTLPYMAPEQIDLKPATAKSDLYSLGVVCYQALTGKNPFDRSSVDLTLEAIRTYSPPPIPQLNPVVNQQIGQAIHRAIAKQPYHRFASAKEFAEALLRAGRNEPIASPDSRKFQPRVLRAKKAIGETDYQFALELLNELESEGNIDPEISLLRVQAEQGMRSRTIRQLLESARARMDEEEWVLAAQKVHSVLELDPENIDARALKTEIERQRSTRLIDKWYQIAREHLDNRLFSNARQAVEEVLKLDPTHGQARELLGEITREEQKLSKLRQEKQQLYEAALRAYNNGELSTALNRLERVIELGKQAPTNAGTEAHFLEFYKRVRSEHDEQQNLYTEGRRALEAKEFDRALQICKDVLARRAADPLFANLKIQVEEVQRQENAAAIAQYHSRAEAEPDLEKKLALLKDAAKQFPNEQAFAQAFKLTKERRDLVNGIVGRARQYEAQAQFLEAVNQWDILRNIYPRYPGLDHELQRLSRRQQEHIEEEAKATWVERIDRAVARGEFATALDLIDSALRESPDDSEIQRLKRIALEGAERSRRGQTLLDEAEHLLGAGQETAAIGKLREARSADAHNPIILSALKRALVAAARRLAKADWRAALPFVKEALAIDPGDAEARNVETLINDAAREEELERCRMEARELRDAGKLTEAVALVDTALHKYPNEIRLSKLHASLLEQQRVEVSNTLTKAAAAGRERAPSRAAGSPESRYSEFRPSAISRSRETPHDASGMFAPSARTAEQTVWVPKAGTQLEEYKASGRQGEAVWHNQEDTTSPSWPATETTRTRSRRRSRWPAWVPPAAAGLLAAALVIGFVWYNEPGERAQPVSKPAQAVTPAAGVPAVTAADKDRAVAPAAVTVAPKPQARSSFRVQLDSTPPGARAVVDDKPDACYTPCAPTVTPGNHKFAFSMAGFATTTRTLDVYKDEPLNVRLMEDHRTIQITSDPPGAVLTVDGVTEGETPIAVRLRPGPHRVKLVKDDLAYEGSFDVSVDSWKPFSLTKASPAAH